MDSALKKKIGRMIVAGFPSPAVDEQARRLVREFEVGNFVLFTRNIVSPEQTAELCEELDALVAERGNSLAPMIGTDQEGGPVSRIHTGAGLFPGAMALAASGVDSAYDVGYNCGRILRAMGVNANFAPVLDVNISPANPIIGARAFSDDPALVARLGVEMMRGLKKANVLSVVKHFPGHGNVSSDSHLGIPRNDTHREVLEATEWMPFKRAFEAGADALMTAHVCYTDVDKKLFATISPALMHDLLRVHMGFSGLALTDCMEMGAVKDSVGTGEGAVLAVEAGCDLLTFSHTAEAVEEAEKCIYDAVRSGRLSESRLDESLGRIGAVKRKYGLVGRQQPNRDLAVELCGDKKIQELNRKISAGSVTLLSKSGYGSDAIKLGKKVFFAPESLALTGAEDKKRKRLCFSLQCAEALGGRGVVTPVDGIDEKTEAMLSTDFELAVLGLYNVRFRPGQTELLRRLEAIGKPLIVVLLGAPYDAALVHRADLVIAAYEYTRLSVNAVIDSLKSGRFPGKLPVRL